MSEQMLIGRKILVVNDSQETTAAVAVVFAEAGARVTKAHRGKDAMQYVAWGGYDLIFVPLATGEVEGSTVLKFIAESRPELLRRTVVLTADPLNRQEYARLQYRYCSCLFLPFISQNLVSYAARALAFSDQACAA